MTKTPFLSLDEWQASRSVHITRDSVWKLDAYRFALYLLYCACYDCAELRPLLSVEDQLVRAVGGVSASIAEGFSRPTAPDQLRLLGYALGSLRECITWYSSLERRLGQPRFEARLALVSDTRGLIQGLIRYKRRRSGKPFRM